MQLNMWHLDWVQYTVRGSGPISEDQLQRDFQAEPYNNMLFYLPPFIRSLISEDEFILDKGTNGYTFSFACAKGLAIYYGNPSNVEMGVNFRMSGSFLSLVCKSIDDDYAISSWLTTVGKEISNKALKFRLTRLDFAYDCDLDFSRFVDSFDKKEFRCAARSNIYKVVNKDNRGTLYFGARSSSKMIRIYDKIQEQIDKLSGDELAEFLEYCNDNNYKSITRVEIQCRENHSSPAASKALEQFNSCDMGSFLCSILEFGCYDGYDHNNNAVFVRFDWYEEQILNFVQCGVKVPYIQTTEINFNWLVSVFGSQLLTLEREAPELLKVIRCQAAISQSLSKRIKKNQAAIAKYIDRYKYGLLDDDELLSLEDLYFDE